MHDDSCRVRQAGYYDIRIMMTLLRELYSLEPGFSYNATKQRSGLRRLLKEPEAAVLVAERDTLILGMCTIQTIVATAEGGRSGLLENNIVHKKFRGQGIGRALLEAAEAWAAGKKLTSLRLIINPGNASTRNFFDAMGWQARSLVCREKPINHQR